MAEATEPAVRRTAAVAEPATMRRDGPTPRAEGPVVATPGNARSRRGAAPAEGRAGVPQQPSLQARTKEKRERGSKAKTPKGKDESVAAPKEAQAAGGNGGEEKGTAVRLLMPPPPSALTKDAKARVQATQSKAALAAKKEKTLPDAQAHVDEAQRAVNEPKEEVLAEANQQQVTRAAQLEPPHPKVVELCQKIKIQVMFGSVEGLVEYARKELATQVEKNTEEVASTYDDVQQEPQPKRKPESGEEIEKPPAEVETPARNAGEAKPDAIPKKDLSLDDDVQATDKKIDEAGLNKPTAKLVDSGVIADVRKERGNLGEIADSEVKEAQKQELAILQQTQAKQEKLDQVAESAMAKERVDTVAANFRKQASMATSEADLRKLFTQGANTILSTTRTSVTNKLTQLKKDVDALWKEKTEPAGKIKNHIKLIGDRVEKRYSGFGGGLRSVGEDIYSFFGGESTKDKLMRELGEAKTEYADLVCAGALDVSRQIETVIKQCKDLIKGARTAIDSMLTAMPASVQAWAQSQKTVFEQQLTELDTKVNATRDQMTAELMVNAVESVHEVEQLVNSIREKAKSVLGKIADFIKEFVDDPVRAIINGLLDLLGISRSTFWRLVEKVKQVLSDIADDPMRFANNLMKALEKGFNQFFDNIGQHLLKGLLTWLFSRLGEVNVDPPKDLSIKGIVGFFLQVMGITWPRIRKILVKHVGEKNVALAEKAFELVKTLMDKGPDGMVEMIKEKLDPKSIFDTVLEAAIEYVIEQLIKKVTLRIIAMLNPVGAILQAIEAIYRVIKWVIDNAARIFKLVETVVDSAVDIMKGAIGGAANNIEMALAGLIPPVIDFLAGFLGLGGLPGKVANIIRGLQEKVEKILDQVIGFIVSKAKGLLDKIGGKGKEGTGKAEIGKKVAFNIGEESHSLWIEMRGKKAQVVMSSKKKKLVPEELSGEDGVESGNPILKKAGDITGKIEPEATRLEGDRLEGKKTAEQLEKEDDNLETLEQQLATLLAGLDVGDKLPPTQVTHVADGDRAKSVIADPVTAATPAGSKPTPSRDIRAYDLMRVWVGSGKKVRGDESQTQGLSGILEATHLLHEDFSGPAVSWNLANASLKGNRNMREPEGKAKELKNDKKKKPRFRYHVKVDYHSNDKPDGKPEDAKDDREKALKWHKYYSASKFSVVIKTDYDVTKKDYKTGLLFEPDAPLAPFRDQADESLEEEKAQQKQWILDAAKALANDQNKSGPFSREDLLSKMREQRGKAIDKNRYDALKAEGVPGLTIKNRQFFLSGGTGAE